MTPNANAPKEGKVITINSKSFPKFSFWIGWNNFFFSIKNFFFFLPLKGKQIHFFQFSWLEFIFGTVTLTVSGYGRVSVNQKLPSNSKRQPQRQRVLKLLFYYGRLGLPQGFFRYLIETEVANPPWPPTATSFFFLFCSSTFISASLSPMVSSLLYFSSTSLRCFWNDLFWLFLNFGELQVIRTPWSRFLIFKSQCTRSLMGILVSDCSIFLVQLVVQVSST